MKNNSEIITRPASEKDKEKILTLLNEVFSGQQRSKSSRDFDYFNWKFLTSPFGKSILTVCEHQEEIVGVDNLWAWHLRFQNETYQAYEACDSVVKKEYRGRRLLETMRSFGISQAKNNDAALLFNFPNSQSLKTNLNYGYHYLGKLSWWVKVISPTQTIKAYLKIANKNNITRNFDINDYCVAVCPELLASLYQKHRTTSLITPDRSLEFFNYRYNQHPSRSYWILSYKDSIACVFTINDNNGIREMVVTDIVGDKWLINSLLKQATKKAKELMCAFLAVVADNHMLGNHLWFKGFIKKREKNMVVYSLNDKIKNQIINFKNWNLSASLHDSI